MFRFTANSPAGSNDPASQCPESIASRRTPRNFHLPDVRRSDGPGLALRYPVALLEDFRDFLDRAVDTFAPKAPPDESIVPSTGREPFAYLSLFAILIFAQNILYL